MLMKCLLVTACLLMIGSSTIAQQTINTSITHDGMQRDYILYVPASYDGSAAVPLVMCFHGYTSSNTAIMTYSGYNNVADTANIIVAYPQGTNYGGASHWNVGGWTVGSTVDDVGFVDALLDSLEMDYNIDTDRVYSTGMSNGGYMSFLLACQLSNRIAAIASITGSMTPETYTACNPQHPTPVLQIHGDADGTVPYNGASWTKSIDDVLDYWTNYNNCGLADTTAKPDINTSDGSTVDQIDFAHGDNCSYVSHYKVYGGGHDWIGAWGNMDVEATVEAWRFMRQFDINGIAGCAASIEEQEKVELLVYPNPASDFLNLQINLETATSYAVTDMTGRIVQEGELNGNNPQINVSGLKAGNYILSMQGVKTAFQLK